MSIERLPSGRYRAKVYDHTTGGNTSVGKILGLKDSTFATKREAKAAREKARAALGQVVRQAVTVESFAERWTSDPIFERPKASTNLHNAERIKGFVKAYGSLPLNLVTDEVVAEWLAGGRRNGTVPALRAMFNDARSAKAGRLVDRNPFAELGLKRSRGNAGKQPPSEAMVWELIGQARKVATPSFAAWLQVACFTGMRPGELDALRWSAVDFGAGRVEVNEQWSAGSSTFTLPKNGSRRVAPMTPQAREALLGLAKTGPFCFTTSRGSHWTPGARAYHWKATRAAAGYEGTLYLATRHFAGAYMTNTLELDPETVAIALGHEDGGMLVRQLYGHKDKKAALDRVQRAYEGADVRPLRAVPDRTI